METYDFVKTARCLIPKLSNLIFGDMHYEEDGLTLSKTQCMLIMEIFHHPTRCMGDLGMHTNVKKSTMSGAISTLENYGLINRATDITDKRKTRLILTEKGNQMAIKLKAKFRATTTAKINTLNQEDITLLEQSVLNASNILEKLEANKNGKI